MKVLNAEQFKEMLISGANNLANRQSDIDALNVFPVPDGDTGTNMNMTFGYGVKETVVQMNNNVGDLAKMLSRNMLMGARGNSGVILSQIFKGFSVAVKGMNTINTRAIADGFLNGAKVAYKAVMRPVEGTILTVVREAAEYGDHYAASHPECEIEEWFTYFVQEANASLSRTPELLPVLAEVGVVDSGGCGLVTILEGFCAALNGKPVTALTSEEKAAEGANKGYCVEVEVALNDTFKAEFDKDRFNRSLSKYCSEVKIVRRKDVVCVHVHTENAGMIITACENFGEMTQVKILSLKKEHTEILDYTEDKPKVHHKYALIAVCNGEGIEEMFRNLRVEFFVKGGQTMNPSTESFVSLIDEIDAEHYIILPNNSNIMLAANQAKDLRHKLDIVVLPSKTILQGISACIAFNPDSSMDSNTKNMNDAISHIISGSVTNAIKDTTYNGLEIHNGDFMGIKGKEIVVSQPDMMEVATALLDSMIDDDSEFVTLIYGLQASEDQAQQLADYIDETYGLDCEVTAGKQDLYPFLIGVE